MSMSISKLFNHIQVSACHDWRSLLNSEKGKTLSDTCHQIRGTSCLCMPACIKLETVFVLGTQCEQKRDNQHEIYMPNANLMLRVESTMLRVGSTSLFRYRHVGMGNAKRSRWGWYPTRGPNAKGFAFWWHIGFKVCYVFE